MKRGEIRARIEAILEGCRETDWVLNKDGDEVGRGGFDEWLATERLTELVEALLGATVEPEGGEG